MPEHLMTPPQVVIERVCVESERKRITAEDAL
jgi:hypothetical protein